MLEKAPGKMVSTSHSPRTTGDVESQLSQVKGAEVGRVASLEIGPQVLDWVEFRCVAGQPLDHQPVALAGDPVAGQPGAVSTEAIPHQQYFSPQLSAQGAQEADHLWCADGPWMQRKEGPHLAAIRRERQRPDRRQLLPVHRRSQHRGAPFGRPGASHTGLFREPAFVQVDNPCSLSGGSPFLQASADDASGQWLLRLAPAPATPVAAGSSPAAPTAARHARGDSAPRTASGSAVRCERLSTARCDSPAPAGPSPIPAPVVPAGSPSAEACDQLAPAAGAPAHRLLTRPGASDRHWLASPQACGSLPPATALARKAARPAAAAPRTPHNQPAVPWAIPCSATTTADPDCIPLLRDSH